MTREIPLSLKGKNKGKYVAIVDDEDYERISSFQWHVMLNDGKHIYAARQKPMLNKRKHVLMHREILGIEDETFIDHADRNGLNNTRENLRAATNSQNQGNRTVNHQSRLGLKGVQHRRKKFRAAINHQGKHIFIGSFPTPEEAARAYDRKSLELFGEFAKTNFPRHEYQGTSAQ
jgi:hypothetical protein